MESSSEEIRRAAADLPEQHLVRVLLDQHIRIRDLLAAVVSARGAAKPELFAQLRVLLAIHESAEKAFLRPLSRATAGSAVTNARLEEETEAERALAGLEGMGVHASDFDSAFDAFARSVLAHAAQEEATEFPTVLAHGDIGELMHSGAALLTAERWASMSPLQMPAGSASLTTSFGSFAAMLEQSRRNFEMSVSAH